jgi:hypothetical protein
MHYVNILFALLLISSLGCEQVDDITGGADTPSVTYPATTLDADFYKPGSSAAPTINWNGDQGSISLASTLDGLSINSTTGQLQWTKMLPPGTHRVDVVVSNSEGQVVVPMTLQNPLSGTFTGTYDNFNFFSFDLLQDGSIRLRADDENDPATGSGTWTYENGKVRAVYAYEGGTNEPAFEATLDQTAAAATLIGDWYYDDSFTNDKRGGTVETEME